MFSTNSTLYANSGSVLIVCLFTKSSIFQLFCILDNLWMSGNVQFDLLDTEYFCITVLYPLNQC